MRVIFTILAVISWISGLIQIYYTGILGDNPIFFIPALITIINCFAWYFVGEMWGTVEDLTEQVYELRKKSQDLIEKVHKLRKRSQ